MLTYNFSTREKILLSILLVVGIVVAWYQFVYLSFQNRVASLDAEIAGVQDNLIINQSQVLSLANMRQVVGEYESQGYAPVHLPAYDNTQNLMAYLNGVLAVSSEYTMSFDDPKLSEEDKIVHRTGTISYNTKTYEQARGIAQSIAHGPYPCKIEALGINDIAAQQNGAKGRESAFSSNIQVTFYEKSTANTDLSGDAQTAEDQGLGATSDGSK